MNRNIQSVPYGYQPQEGGPKGTLIYYDSFEQITDEQLDLAVECIEQYSFTKLVLYPLHEETVRVMLKKSISAFHKREKRLSQWKQGQDNRKLVIELWEGRRKKYTSMDSALRYVVEKYKGPYFLYITPENANMFASFSSFDEWIVKIRLLFTHEPQELHAKLEQHRHRFSVRQDL